MSKMKALIFGFMAFAFFINFLTAQELDVPTPAGKLTDKSITAYVDTLVLELFTRNLFSGTILIAKDGKSLYTKAVGEASKEFSGSPTRWRLSSLLISKS